MAKKKFKLTVLPDNITLRFIPGQGLKQILTGGGIFLNYPCGGNGTCGKCLIQLIDGVCPEPTLSDRRFISSAKLSRGYRLACQLVPAGNLVIKIPPMSRATAGKLLLDTPIKRKLSFAPAVQKIFLATLKPATIRHQLSDADLLSEQLKTNSWSLT
ncbi:MAG: 2Fe-2S iron-sulfur cluster-binding protein, partial [Candidatus Sumerlaeia bacterium]|nr:2Fe-2S iron-sulfur cluster-binding protein [Candidatus Sumerlaeia bacterium]